MRKNGYADDQIAVQVPHVYAPSLVGCLRWHIQIPYSRNSLLLTCESEIVKDIKKDLEYILSHRLTSTLQ